MSGVTERYVIHGVTIVTIKTYSNSSRVIAEKHDSISLFALVVMLLLQGVDQRDIFTYMLL